MAERWDGLDDALERALRPVATANDRSVVLFSGGVDSALLAWELRSRAETTLFTVGLPGSDDLDRAARHAPSLGGRWSGRTLSDADLERTEQDTTALLEGLPGPRRGVFLALAAAVAYAPAGLLVCGQGADELFFGYAHFRGLSVEEASARSAVDLRRLAEEDWPRTRRIAVRYGRELVAPYLAPEFVRAIAGLSVEERLPGAVGKECLRRWARHRGLPEGPRAEPKRALQFGSGVDRWLRRRHRRAP